MVAKIILLDGTTIPVDPSNGKTFTLDELSSHVGGGYIQILDMPGCGETLMVIDEEGKLKNLPKNELATKLWLEGTDPVGSGGFSIDRMTNPNNVIPETDFVVGQVLLCHKSQIE